MQTCTNGIVHKETVPVRRFVHFHHLDQCQCRVYVLSFCFRPTSPGSRDPVPVEPSSCPGKGQDPIGDPETLEVETAPASKAATRAARPPTNCSILVTLVVIVAIDWETVWTQLSNLDTLRVSNGSGVSCESISLTLSSNVLERPPILSRSGSEPSGEPKFEDKAATGEPGKEVYIASSNVRALAIKTDGIRGEAGCRHLGQEIKRKPRLTLP